MDIYCIRRDKEILALGNFDKVPDMTVDKLSESRYILSSLITPEEESAISQRIIKGINKRIDFWIQEKRYLRRLIISSLVFLAVYFLCSLVVRDPLPLIDELLVALAFAILTWIMLSRRDLQAKEARELKQKWKGNIISAELIYSSTIDDIEEYFRKIEGLSYKEIPNMIIDGTLPIYEEEIDNGFLSALDSYLRYSRKLEKRYLSDINAKKIRAKKLYKSLIQDYSTGNLDLYFLAFYVGYSRNR